MLRPQAPPSSRFPAFPLAWHLLCESRELAAGPRSFDLAGRRLVAFRGGDGRAAVLDAHCSHLGADLGKGRVEGGLLVCPFHAWAYGPDGRCLRIPGSAEVPAFARQTAYPALERSGFLFVWNGPEPLLPLPFFDGFEEEALAAGRPHRFTVDSPWYMITANGFDGQHLLSVHDRRLLGEQEVEPAGPLARRLRYAVEVTGRSASDRLLRRLAGPVARVVIDVWAASLVFVEARFDRAVSRGVLVAVRPLAPGRTELWVVPFAPRRRGPLGRAVQPLELAVRGRLTAAFIGGDLDRLHACATTVAAGAGRPHAHRLLPLDRHAAGPGGAAGLALGDPDRRRGRRADTPDRSPISRHPIFRRRACRHEENDESAVRRRLYPAAVVAARRPGARRGAAAEPGSAGPRRGSARRRRSGHAPRRRAGGPGRRDAGRGAPGRRGRPRPAPAPRRGLTESMVHTRRHRGRPLLLDRTWSSPGRTARSAAATRACGSMTTG